MTDGADAIVIREMLLSDSTAVAELERRIFPDAWSEESIRESAQDSQGGGLIAESSDSSESKLLGYACYYSAAEETHLTNLAVAPEQRRCGIGTKLLMAIFEQAHSDNSTAIYLEVRASNEAAKSMYLSRGFSELYHRKNYYRDPLEDAIVYVYQLTQSDQ